MNTEENLVESELTRLFGQETVEQARLIDVADLNLDAGMTACITTGLNQLKQTRNDPAAQGAVISAMQPGERLLLCMWVMEMELLDRLRAKY